MKLKNILIIVSGAFLLSSPVIAGGGGGSKESVKPAELAAAAESVQLMATGKKQIDSKEWTLAIATFKKLTEIDSKNADAYNYLAYSTRKNGKPADALTIYEKALQLDPKHLGALEYQGEAYVELNKVAEAKKNLEKLKALCGTSCEQYIDLDEAIKKVKK